jgi:glycine dehydrogenase subunit 2
LPGPTETEDKAALDEFVATMERILDEVAASPDALHQAPRITSISRPDEVMAARNPVLTWKPGV